LPNAAKQLWLCLVGANGFVPVDGLSRIVLAALARQHPTVEMMVRLRDFGWKREFTQLIVTLAALGAVELTLLTSSGHRSVPVDPADDNGVDPILVRLTPLGLRGAQVELARRDIDLTSPEGSARLSLEDVCVAMEHAPPAEIEAALASWVGSREPGPAASELAGLCVGTTPASVRMLAMIGLNHTGVEGAEHRRRLRAAGGAIGAMASEWLV
jgi:hypothetical protein